MNCCVTNRVHYTTKIEIERKTVSEHFYVKKEKANNLDRFNYFYNTFLNMQISLCKNVINP